MGAHARERRVAGVGDDDGVQRPGRREASHEEVRSVPGTQAPGTKRKAYLRGRVGINVHVSEETWRALRYLALVRRTTLQAVVEEVLKERAARARREGAVPPSGSSGEEDSASG